MASGGFYGRVDNPNDRPPKHAFPGSIAFQQLDPIVEEGIIDEQRTNWHQRNAILLSGNPGQYCDDAPLREAKRSIDAADASARPQVVGVHRVLDHIQQFTPDHISPQAKNSLERLLLDDRTASWLLLIPQEQNSLSAAIANPIPQQLAQRVTPARRQAQPKSSARRAVTQKSYRVRTPAGQPSDQSTRSSKLSRRHQKRRIPSCTTAEDALPTPEASDMSISDRITRSAAKGNQKAEENPRDNPANRHLFQFRADDDEAFENFCMKSFVEIQQLRMKDILKAWIKELEPKKQKRFPYCRKDGDRPQWWPPTELVQHKEPDHISKEERSTLAMTIMRWMMRPEVNPAGSEGIDRLEESTKSVKLKHDKDTPVKTERRRRLLEQLYSVARMRLDYEQGGRDGDDIISVSELYREPPRKRYKKKTIMVERIVELSPPHPDVPSEETLEDDDYKMETHEEPPPLNFSFNKTDQPAPIPMAMNSAINHVSQIFQQLPGMMQHLDTKPVPEPPYLGQSPFHAQQLEAFTLNPIYQPSTTGFHEQPIQPTQGIQTFQTFAPPAPEWQHTIKPPIVSPIASHSAANTSFNSSYEEMDASWEIMNPAPIMNQIQQQTTRSYSMSDRALTTPVSMPVTVAAAVPTQHAYPSQLAADVVMGDFNSSGLPDEALHQPSQTYTPWPQAQPQPHVRWPPTFSTYPNPAS